MYYFKDYDELTNGTELENGLKDRAIQSLNALKSNLNVSIDTWQSGHTETGKQRLSSSVHPRILTWKNGTLLRPRQSDAATQLRSLLDSPAQTTNSTPYMPPTTTQAPSPDRSLPSPEEAATLLKNQAVYASHLEAESRYVKEEMAVLRMKLAEIMEENRSLHSELKTTVVHEILKDGGEVFNIMGSLEDDLSDLNASHFKRTDLRKWQIELERLSKLHEAKSERLEAQLQNSKAQNEQLEQTIDDLKSQLRIQDSVPTHENGLTGNYFMSETERNITTRTIEKITRERDELMDHVTSLKSQLQEMSHREEEAYQQMKKGIHLVEQAQLEQTEALVQKEQVSDELARVRERFDAHVLESQKLVRAERETVRRENQTLIDDLNNKLKEMGEFYALVQSKYDKEVRDKASLTTEMNELKSQLRLSNKEGTVTAESYRAETTNASIQRNSAFQESSRLRTELEKVKYDYDQEMSRSKIECDDLRQRLSKAERGLVNSKEECIHMTGNIQALERELHLAKMARDSVERTRSDDLKVIRKQAENREEEMKLKMENAEDKHNQAVHEMDTMLLKQNKLIMKLREELKKQGLNLEKTVKKYRTENSKLTTSNIEMSQRLERMSSRLSELEGQTDQHVKVHDKMRERLKALDGQSQHQAVQLVECLSKFSSVSRDRQLLAREVEFLRSQLIRANQSTPEVIKISSTSKTMVDDILNAMTKEERSGMPGLIPELQLDSSSVPEKISVNDLVAE